MKHFKSNLALLLALMVIAPFFYTPFKVSAAPQHGMIDVTATPQTSYFKVIRDTAITNADQQQIAGILKQGAIFRLKQSDLERIYFQWGESLAVVPTEDVEIIQVDGQNVCDWQAFNPSQIKGYLSFREKSEAIDPNSGNPLVILEKGTIYPYVDHQNESYQIILGERLLKIAKDHRVMEHPTLAEALEAKNSQEEQASQPVFTPQDRFFEVIEEHTPIYVNLSGSFIKAGELIQGQAYPRLDGMNNGMKSNLATEKLMCQ